MDIYIYIYIYIYKIILIKTLQKMLKLDLILETMNQIDLCLNKITKKVI